MEMLLTTLDYTSFFHAMMATIPSSILIFDERLAVLTVNHNFLEKSRGSLESISGRRLHEVFPGAFRDTPLDQQIREVVVTGRTLHRLRTSYRAPGVSLRVYSYSICPLQLHDGSRGAILVMDDVTDLLRLGEEVRRMQLHLASIVDSAGDLIISTDPRGAIMTWNMAAEKATGFVDSEVRGVALADLIEEPQNLEVEACFRGITEIDDGRSVEWPMRCRHADSIPVSWRLSRMTGEGGEVTGVVVVGRNLVEQRTMEAQMRQGEKLAALGMVIGGIAHEIRSPLGVSSAAAQLMRQRITSPPLLEDCIARVIGGIDRASLIVESLLRFARPRPITETTKVSVDDMLKNALMLASGEVAAGTTVDWRLPSEADALYAEGVQNLLELVFINLILNAFQAMPNGGRLVIGASRDRAEIAITIGDTGPGIPEAHLSKIFDPFFTTRSDGRRSGLGLWVSQAIVRQHGGSVDVRTSHGGTTFVVRLPLARTLIAATPTGEPSHLHCG
ncbi:MAG: ATP-binding protein [Azospirillaceae bacterium]|nr:ATP-binding protein [Azospirillaceae bacterium]